MTLPLSRIRARIAAIRAELDALEKDLVEARDEVDSPWMTVAQYAAHARVHPDTVRRVWLVQGMPHAGKGKLTRIQRDDADAWRRKR